MPNTPVEITPQVPSTPKPNFLSPPATEEERTTQTYKRNFFHNNWIDQADSTERDLAPMIPEACKERIMNVIY